MRRIATMMFCAAAFVLIAAPIYMEKTAHALTINGKPFGNVVSINGVLALSVEEFSKAVGGGPANVQVQGNKLSIGPALQPSSSAGSSFTTAAHGSGGGAGKVSVHDISITKHADSASPLLFREGKAFVRLDDVAKFFGGTLTVNGGTLRANQAISLNFAPNPGAAIGIIPGPH